MRFCLRECSFSLFFWTRGSARSTRRVRIRIVALLVVPQVQMSAHHCGGTQLMTERSMVPVVCFTRISEASVTCAYQMVPFLTGFPFHQLPFHQHSYRRYSHPVALSPNPKLILKNASKHTETHQRRIYFCQFVAILSSFQQHVRGLDQSRSS